MWSEVSDVVMLIPGEVCFRNRSLRNVQVRPGVSDSLVIDFDLTRMRSGVDEGCLR